MFLKRTRSKNFTYLSLVETYREDGQVRHRTLLQFGREDELRENRALQRLVDSIARVANTTATIDRKESSKLPALENIQEQSRTNWGVVKVYRALWNLFELDTVLKKACRSSRRAYDLSSTVFSTVLGRLMRPSSKLKVYERQSQYFGLKEAELQHLYRAMDALADGKDEIEHELFERQRNLFNMKIDIVLYNVTTLYLESARSDDLKAFGHSKDAKFGEAQVVLGLLVDMQGRPIGFDLFPGNTFEGHTLIQTLSKLRHRFQIRQVVIVADRGINSKLNLYAIKEAGFDYIVGTRIKNLPKAIQEKILNRDEYRSLVKDENESVQYRALDYVNKVTFENEDGIKGSQKLSELLICTWSKARAEKDARDRHQLVDRARQLLSTPSKIPVRRGPRRFITADHSANPTIDQARIDEDAKWDGFYGIQSSQKNLAPSAILDAYHSLWKIEESFRVIKHTLRARPIFHWTPQRIKGHLVMCFIAFLLERTLELTLEQKQIKASTDTIREALSSLEVSTLTADGQTFYLTSPVQGLANSILRALKLPLPRPLADSPPI